MRLCLLGQNFKNVPGVKIIFTEKCPTLFKNVFEDLSSKLWLHFLCTQSASIHQAVFKVEGQSLSANETATEISHLKDNFAQKLISFFHLLFNCKTDR